MEFFNRLLKLFDSSWTKLFNTSRLSKGLEFGGRIATGQFLPIFNEECAVVSLAIRGCRFYGSKNQF
ncbi:MAG: hypothetical protein AUI16_13515 [Alphaproteobacteria bacterium 13_2_20CM_2_64_7]|nr:MAG: hypothetical protein AUI16_13515 [Alphaproteobacteria bacterium 13_2_20CM_2_64_7]